VENWTGAQGGTGTSLNFYSPVAGLWRQVWVSPLDAAITTSQLRLDKAGRV
jgi:hypothetical protein